MRKPKFTIRLLLIATLLIAASLPTAISCYEDARAFFLPPSKLNQPQPARNVRTELTESSVIHLAKDFAKEQQSDFEKYEVAGCEYLPTFKDGSWLVFFDMNPPLPGCGFIVIVHDKTKTMQLEFED